MTEIYSNGSKWLGEEPDSVEVLLGVLAQTPLDPRFEQYGNFVSPSESVLSATSFFGNFWEVSHVFRIDSDDPAVVGPLTQAIAANVATPAYQAARAEYLAHQERQEAERAAREQQRQERARWRA